MRIGRWGIEKNKGQMEKGFACVVLKEVSTFTDSTSLIPIQRDFPGGPVAKTPNLPMQGAQVLSLVKTLDCTCHN